MLPPRRRVVSRTSYARERARVCVHNEQTYPPQAFENDGDEWEELSRKRQS